MKPIPSQPRDGFPPLSAGTAWRLHEPAAPTVVGHHGEMLDIADPAGGIRPGPEPAAFDGLLGLRLPDACLLVDHWIRGEDVTAVYESSDGCSLRATAMWRCVRGEPDVHAWQLVASVQTALPTTEPDVAVVSAATATDMLWGGIAEGGLRWQSERPPAPTCVLFAREGATPKETRSVLVALHPGEFHDFDLSWHGRRAVVESRLFAAPLEKGVLLRSRVLAAIGPAERGATWATRLVDTFFAAPPLLTT